MMSEIIYLNKNIEGSSEFNSLLKAYVCNKSGIDSDVLYKELVVLLCTILEVNTENATSKWFIIHKDSLHIRDLKYRKNFQKKLLEDIIEVYNDENSRYDYSLYNQIISNINVLSNEDNLLCELNYDFKITFGPKHGISEFIKLLNKIGIRDIFAEIDYNENNIFSNVKTNSKDVIGRLIRVRNEIIHENHIDTSIDKIDLIVKSIYCVNQYFKKLYYEIGE